MGVYGSDTSTRMGPERVDLDTTGAELDDEGIIGEDLVRAVTTDEGALFWAPGKTLNLNRYLGKTMDAGERAAVARQIEGLFADDDRYASIEAQLSYVSGRLVASIAGETDTGPFTLQLEQDGEEMRVVRTEAAAA